MLRRFFSISIGDDEYEWKEHQFLVAADWQATDSIRSIDEILIAT